MVGADVGELPALLLIALDEGADGGQGKLMRGILIAVGDNGHDGQGIHLLALHGMHTGDGGTHCVIQRGHAAGIVVLVGKRFHFGNRHVVIDGLQLAAAKGYQCHHVCLVRVLFLGTLDGADGLVHAIDGLTGDAAHGAALVKDNHVVNSHWSFHNT